MSPDRFDHLLSLVGPIIAKKHCKSRKPISPSEHLAVTLRYLATGDSQQSHTFYFRIGRSTVSNIVKETCNALWTALNQDYLKSPSTEEQWTNIADEFEREWNFPHCIGALDGKHISMECPRNAGSAFFNYKNFHSIVLLATCDAKYCFTLIDIGAYGRENDAGVLTDSAFGQAFESDAVHLNLPQPVKVGTRCLPYVLVGDDIFPLKEWLMKPYPGKNLTEPERVFNYRLSRARRTIENAFGILAAKWHIFRRPIRGSVNLLENITRATVCLHNYLQLTDNAAYIPERIIDSEDSAGNIVQGDWREVVENDGGLRNLGRLAGNRYKFNASKVRNDLKDYFNQEGQVPWQLCHVRSCGNVNS